MPQSYYVYVTGELFSGVLIVLWLVFGFSPLDMLIQLLYGLTAVKG